MKPPRRHDDRYPQPSDSGRQHLARPPNLRDGYLVSLERGERNPPIRTLYRLAGALEATVPALLPPAVDEMVSDGLISCPACDLCTKSNAQAIQNGEPCRGCSLPAAVIEQVLAARWRTVGPYA